MYDLDKIDTIHIFTCILFFFIFIFMDKLIIIHCKEMGWYTGEKLYIYETLTECIHKSK